MVEFIPKDMELLGKKTDKARITPLVAMTLHYLEIYKYIYVCVVKYLTDPV